MVLRYSRSNISAFQSYSLMKISLAAHQFKSRISMQKGRIKINPKSFVEIVQLLRARGNRLIITAEGEDADKAVVALMDLAVASTLAVSCA